MNKTEVESLECELVWLKENYPDKEALIACAEQRLQTTLKGTGGGFGALVRCVRPIVHSETPEEFSFRNRDVFVR